MSSNNSYRHARQIFLPLPLGTTARTIEDSNLSLQADNYLMFDALRAAKCDRLTSSQLDQILSWCQGEGLQLYQNGFDQWVDRTLHFWAVLGSSSSVQDNSAPFWATPGPQTTPAQFWTTPASLWATTRGPALRRTAPAPFRTSYRDQPCPGQLQPRSRQQHGGDGGAARSPGRPNGDCSELVLLYSFTHQSVPLPWLIGLVLCGSGWLVGLFGFVHSNTSFLFGLFGLLLFWSGLMMKDCPSTSHQFYSQYTT